MGGKRKPRFKTYGKQARRGQIPFSSLDNDMYFPNSNEIDQSQKPPALPPNKPTSQKAATMAVEPDEEKIMTLMEFCAGMSRTDAVRYLKVR